MVETIYKIAGAPRLALLADLHNHPYSQVISSVSSHRSSLIAITGDILYGSHPEGDESPLVSQTNVLSFLSDCTAIAPTFLSLGNHEWMLDEEDIKEIERTGVVVLDNGWVERDGVVIGGLTSGYVTDYRAFRDTQDGAERYPKKENLSGIKGVMAEHVPETAWLEGFASAPGFHVLLSHHPEYWPEVKEKKIEVMLSGHAHGGQWRFFNRGVWCPGQGLWPRWTKGVYEEKRLVVSAGLSNTASVPRLFNPCEVVFVEGD